MSEDQEVQIGQAQERRDRRHHTQRRAVAGGLQVAVDGVEEPERGVGRVVQAFLLAFGE